MTKGHHSQHVPSLTLPLPPEHIIHERTDIAGTNVDAQVEMCWIFNCADLPVKENEQDYCMLVKRLVKLRPVKVGRGPSYRELEGSGRTGIRLQPKRYMVVTQQFQTREKGRFLVDIKSHLMYSQLMNHGCMELHIQSHGTARCRQLIRTVHLVWYVLSWVVAKT